MDEGLCMFAGGGERHFPPCCVSTKNCSHKVAICLELAIWLARNLQLWEQIGEQLSLVKWHKKKSVEQHTTLSQGLLFHFFSLLCYYYYSLWLNRQTQKEGKVAFTFRHTAIRITRNRKMSTSKPRMTEMMITLKGKSEIGSRHKILQVSSFIHGWRTSQPPTLVGYMNTYLFRFLEDFLTT